MESGEAQCLARELAERRGTSVDEAVVASLRAALVEAAPDLNWTPQSVRVPDLANLTPEQRADYEAMKALVREASAYVIPGATSDHSDMYDENGLPI